MAFVCFFALLFKPSFAAQLWLPYRQARGLPLPPPPERELEVKPPEAPEKLHASGLFLLSMLQREGRFIDFLQEDVAPFSDEEVGAAARVVHEGCRKLLREYLNLEPVLKQSEGDKVTVPVNFDAGRIRLTGNVAGVPPYTGSLKHHGWVTRAIRLPPVPEALDPKVLAPAEVELT
jgi:hypothetical protein